MNRSVETAVAYVGGGLPGGDRVDASEGDRKEPSRSYGFDVRTLGEVACSKPSGERVGSLETEFTETVWCRMPCFTARTIYQST